MSVTVRTIMREWLLRHGYDGLVNDDAECGCRVMDGTDVSDRFMECLCRDAAPDCQPAYQREPTDNEREYDGHEWIMTTEKPGEGEIEVVE